MESIPKMNNKLPLQGTQFPFENIHLKLLHVSIIIEVPFSNFVEPEKLTKDISLQCLKL